MNLKFYISCILVNFTITYYTLVSFEFLISKYIVFNETYPLLQKLSVVCDNSITYSYNYLFCMFSPLIILFYRKFQFHWRVFIFISTLIAVIYFFYNYNNYILEGLYYEITFFMIVSFFISLLIHSTQRFIGKKLLPELYKK